MLRNLNWKGIDADTRESCAVNFLQGCIVVRSEISGWYDMQALTAEYVIKLDDKWQVLEFDISFQTGNKPGRRYAMYSNKEGYWRDSLGTHYAEFDGCRYIDITLTPLTNSLPINGLLLSEGEGRYIDVLYVDVIENKLSRDRQRYTRLSRLKYRFENDNGNFTADIDVDEEGFVTHYPELFETIYHGI